LKTLSIDNGENERYSSKVSVIAMSNRWEDEMRYDAEFLGRRCFDELVAGCAYIRFFISLFKLTVHIILNSTKYTSRGIISGKRSTSNGSNSGCSTHTYSFRSRILAVPLSLLVRYSSPSLGECGVDEGYIGTTQSGSMFNGFKSENLSTYIAADGGGGRFCGNSHQYP
jgi:hypothetical protein